jgi:hypothetical protein
MTAFDLYCSLIFLILSSAQKEFDAAGRSKCLENCFVSLQFSTVCYDALACAHFICMYQAKTYYIGRAHSRSHTGCCVCSNIKQARQDATGPSGLFSGYFRPPVSSDYTFISVSDDNSMVWMNLDRSDASKMELIIDFVEWLPLPPRDWYHSCPIPTLHALNPGNLVHAAVPL